MSDPPKARPVAGLILAGFVAVLTSLLAAWDAYGLIDDQTSA